MKNSSENKSHTFKEVLFIGPSMHGAGGIASLLATYRDALPEFHHLSTNSHRGTIPGLFNYARTLCALPFMRLRGFKTLDVHGANGKSWTRKRNLIRLAKMLGFEVVYHMHGGELDNYVQRHGREHYTNIFTKCKAVVFLTPAWQKYAIENLGLADARVLENVVSVPPRKPRAPRPGEPLRLIYLGYIYKEKGIFDLLDVIAENADRWRGKLKLTVGGKWNEERLTSFIADNKLQDIVDFRGWVSGDEKLRLMDESHVLILPSYFEGLPMSILEAMSSGMPVISTPVGGIPEVVTDGVDGRLVAPGDKSAITAAIQQYIDNPSLVLTQGQAAQEHAKRFSPEEGLRRLAEILK